MTIRMAFSFLLISIAHETCLAQTAITTDFSRGSFASMGWKAKGGWDIFRYANDSRHNPGRVARFGAHKGNGSLTKAVSEVNNPRKLTLSLDYGWGWGGPAQGADSISFMLLDPRGNGYVFEVHRTRATWAVQWGRVADHTPAKDKTWAPEPIDATQTSVRDGGDLRHLTVTRLADGTWTVSSKDWNKGSGGSVSFIDTNTTSFSQIVLMGVDNFDDQLFNKIKLDLHAADRPEPTTATPATAFLGSIGVVTSFPDRGQPLPRTVQMVKYAGFRWIRGGIEGLTRNGPTTIETYLDLHRQTGVKFSWGLVSGGTAVEKLIGTAQQLAKADALLAFEGNNEPNNWGVTYQGQKGGGAAPSWLAVAKLQRDLYHRVKTDPLLREYPVWSISENGAETDNVGLQFLTIPRGMATLMPAGTRYADFANVHNYVYHPGSPGLQDNKTWNAADPTSVCKVDGLYGNYGVTWAKRFHGYSEAELLTLPRVTTETGCTIAGPITEEIQALNLLTMYLDQFKRGGSYTAVYLLRDRTDEGGNQSFGFFTREYKPRKAAVYLHNLTTILADSGSAVRPGRLDYAIPEEPAAVHDMLLQKSDGTFALVVWDEQLKGDDEVTIRLARPYSRVNVYDPTMGTQPVQTHARVEQLKLRLRDHPLVVAISAK